MNSKSCIKLHHLLCAWYKYTIDHIPNVRFQNQKLYLTNGQINPFSLDTHSLSNNNIYATGFLPNKKKYKILIHSSTPNLVPCEKKKN